MTDFLDVAVSVGEGFCPECRVRLTPDSILAGADTVALGRCPSCQWRWIVEKDVAAKWSARSASSIGYVKFHRNAHRHDTVPGAHSTP